MLENIKKIILLRHGEASGSPDIQRQLTQQGQSQARSVGKTLTTLDIVPDIVLCSGVDRTRQTLAAMELPEDIEVIFCGEELYRAQSHRDILDIIAEHIPADKNCPLVIGHNPTIHEAVLHLSKESRGPKFGHLESSYPTGTATIFEFTSDDWGMLHPSTCKLTHVISSL